MISPPPATEGVTPDISSKKLQHLLLVGAASHREDATVDILGADEAVLLHHELLDKVRNPAVFQSRKRGGLPLKELELFERHHLAIVALGLLRIARRAVSEHLLQRPAPTTLPHRRLPVAGRAISVAQRRFSTSLW